ncbi:ROK family protein, partial [Actinoallomurus acaciae]
AARLRGSAVSFAELRDGLPAGAGWAVGALEPAWDALGAAVTTLGELFNPDVAVIGGGVAAELPGFTEAVADRVIGYSRPGYAAPSVRRAKLGGLSSLHGAVLLAEREEAHRGRTKRRRHRGVATRRGGLG